MRVLRRLRKNKHGGVINNGYFQLIADVLLLFFTAPVFTKVSMFDFWILFRPPPVTLFSLVDEEDLAIASVHQDG